MKTEGVASHFEATPSNLFGIYAAEILHSSQRDVILLVPCPVSGQGVVFALSHICARHGILFDTLGGKLQRFVYKFYNIIWFTL